jgi:hypothetical protein
MREKPNVPLPGFIVFPSERALRTMADQQITKFTHLKVTLPVNLASETHQFDA